MQTWKKEQHVLNLCATFVAQPLCSRRGPSLHNCERWLWAQWWCSGATHGIHTSCHHSQEASRALTHPHDGQALLRQPCAQGLGHTVGRRRADLGSHM